LPSFWRDSFKDKDLIAGVAYSVAAVGAELYARALATVPAMSIVDCPTSYRPERHAISIRSSRLVPLSGGRWACNLDPTVESVGVIRSKSPTGHLTLTVGEDFSVTDKYQDVELSEFTEVVPGARVIVFSDNPFSWEGTGKSVPHSSEYYSTVEAPYLLRRPVSPTADYLSIGAGDYIYVSNGEDHCKCLVAHVQEDVSDELDSGLYLYVSTPAPYIGQVQAALTPEGLQDELSTMHLQSTTILLEDTEIILMAVSPVVDRQYLWKLYGSLLGYDRSRSTEELRSKILGRHLLAAGKFTRSNVAAAVSYLLNLPVIGGVDEVIISIDDLADGGYVVTTSNTRVVVESNYVLNPLIPDRALLLNGEDNDEATSKGVIVSEPTSVVSTYDIYDISSGTDTWWKTDRLELNSYMLPYHSATRSMVGNGETEPNLVGAGNQDARVGDYTVVIGAQTREKLAHALTRDFYLDKIVVISKPQNYTGSLITDSILEFVREATPSDMALLVHAE